MSSATIAPVHLCTRLCSWATMGQCSNCCHIEGEGENCQVFTFMSTLKNFTNTHFVLGLLILSIFCCMRKHVERSIYPFLQFSLDRWRKILCQSLAKNLSYEMLPVFLPLNHTIKVKKLILIVGNCGVSMSRIGVELFKEHSLLLPILCFSRVLLVFTCRDQT